MTTTSSPAPGHAWHALGVREVLADLGADAASGLAPDEARRRLSRVGPNRVGEHPETSLWRLLLDQFRSVVVLLLLAAAGIAWALDERAEGLAIMAARGLNAAIGFASEWRARRSLARLRAIVVPHAIVRRGGHQRPLGAPVLVATPEPLTWVALAALVGLQWLSISLHPLARLLGTVPMATADLVVLGTAVLWPVIVLETIKVWGGAKSVGRQCPNRSRGRVASDGKVTRNH